MNIYLPEGLCEDCLTPQEPLVLSQECDKCGGTIIEVYHESVLELIVERLRRSTDPDMEKVEYLIEILKEV